MTIKPFSNFSQAIHTTSTCFRPDTEEQLITLCAENKNSRFLARGNGLSYSDCCVFDQGIIIDTSRLNHLLSFDSTTGIVICQGAVTFADLFCLDAQYIPPVLPGTVYATVAGGIANDVHGKNNPHFGNFGHHIDWLELLIGEKILRCSRDENSNLFFATIAGLGLTGVIKQVAIRLRKATRFVSKVTEKHTDLAILIQRMLNEGLQHDYQVAWLDLLNEPRGLLSFADHVEFTKKLPAKRVYNIPKIPMRLISPWLIKQFNRAYYHQAKTECQTLPLWQFNNPLDGINNWNRLYGKKGLLQFQAVFDRKLAETTLHKIGLLIQSHQATSTLAVLKYFTHAGLGLLSFTQPGFTLAIDFINNPQAAQVIGKLNQVISELGGKVYLAKDRLLTKEQFTKMYKNHEQFSNLLTENNSPMFSDLGKRLGIREYNL